ncbi:hypothetical protein FGO68_gene6342 [Halteria grandinella]|uniref:Uncharacterized protein n=1 Tax=Halteria grandinella TaxID=5974 RepID=A0A8J8SZX6_HALGN|nr:hypothetical protein FGO68_gene6342 [Halteria grandinella]
MRGLGTMMWGRCRKMRDQLLIGNGPYIGTSGDAGEGAGEKKVRGDEGDLGVHGVGDVEAAEGGGLGVTEMGTMERTNGVKVRAAKILGQMMAPKKRMTLGVNLTMNQKKMTSGHKALTQKQSKAIRGKIKELKMIIFKKKNAQQRMKIHGSKKVILKNCLAKGTGIPMKKNKIYQLNLRLKIICGDQSCLFKL